MAVQLNLEQDAAWRLSAHGLEAVLAKWALLAHSVEQWCAEADFFERHEHLDQWSAGAEQPCHHFDEFWIAGYLAPGGRKLTASVELADVDAPERLTERDQHRALGVQNTRWHTLLPNSIRAMSRKRF